MRAINVAAGVALGILYASQAAAQADPRRSTADVVPRQEAFKACLTDKTVELGKNNSDSPETVLRVAAALCREQEESLWTAYSEMPIPGAQAKLLMDRDRKAGESAGVGALLAVRARH